MVIAIVNGPNLNLLGQRETNIYGTVQMDTYMDQLKSTYDCEFLYFQSNLEGALIDFLQSCGADGIILNGGGYSHTSVSLRDCVSSIQVPVIEVHLSNLSARESFRHESLLTPVCIGCIMGFGLESYGLAVRHFLGN